MNSNSQENTLTPDWMNALNVAVATYSSKGNSAAAEHIEILCRGDGHV